MITGLLYILRPKILPVRRFAMALVVLVLLVLGATNSLALGKYKDPNYVSGRNAIVHLFEWKWTDIAMECERFLGPMGFGGVQVSPVQENVIISGRPWWERYQPISYRLLTRSGDESQFRDMVQRCNKVGVRVYVDTILNHMCADQNNQPIGTGGSSANPPSRSYPAVPFSSTDFNNPCTVSDFNNPIEVRNCELLGLHDLNQGVEYVRKKIVDFLNTIIDIGVAGFRIDAAKHMWPGDLEIIYSHLHDLNKKYGFRDGARPYIYQEVVDLGTVDRISKKEYSGIAAVSEFKYGTELSAGIRGNNPLKWFKNFGAEWGLLPSGDAHIFIDNHDNQRNGYGTSVLTYKDSKHYKMAVAFMLAHPYGNPVLMSSYAFDQSNQGPPADSKENIISPEIKDDGSCGAGWICEHRWRQIYNMIGFRNVVGNDEIKGWWDNGNNQIAFSRGNAGFIAFNAESHDLKIEIHTELPAGLYCDVITGNVRNGTCTGKTVVVNSNGYAYIEITSNEEDGVLAIHQNVKLD